MVRIKRLLDILAGVVALLSLAPLLGYLDRPLLLLALLAVPVGFCCDRRERYPLPGWLATLLSLAGIALYAAQITRAEVALPVVHALVVLLVVRLLTPKEGRDYLQIFVLALFILAGTSLIHLEIGFIVYLVLLVFSVTLGLVLLTVHVSDRSLSMSRADLVKLVRIGLILPAASLLLMIVFFVILPRTRHPLWNFLNPTAKGVVGLAETVQPGSFASISTVKQLAFRAEGPRLAPDQRYWRALVLNQLQQHRWVRVAPPESGGLRNEGPAPLIFTIYPEPRSDRYLVTLDRPGQLSGLRNVATSDQMFIATSALDHRLRFEVRSSPGAALKLLGPIDRSFYLQLPQDISPRVRQAAAAIRDANATTAARLDAMERFFLSQKLSYAQDDLPAGPDVVDSFLFEKKRGYCEFFASAYATMARLAGIPSRLVGGYYGGEYNSLGGYYLVGEESAHVWVEVLDDASRWRRIDPSQWAVNAATSLGARGLGQLNAFRQLVDSLNYFWVQAVVVFDLKQQIELLRGAGNSLRGLPLKQTLSRGWRPVLVVLAALALFTVPFLVRRRSPEARLLERFRARVVRRYGVDLKQRNLGLEELAEQVDDDLCRRFAAIYYGALFRDRKLSRGERRQLEALLARI
jgi:transglutaminase-like putative cysteine protease